MEKDGDSGSKVFSGEAMAQTAQILFLGIAAQLDQGKLRRDLEQLARLPTESRLPGVRDVVLAFASQLVVTPGRGRDDKVRKRLRGLCFLVGAVSFGLCGGAVYARTFFPAAYALVLALFSTGLGVILLPFHPSP